MDKANKSYKAVTIYAPHELVAELYEAYSKQLLKPPNGAAPVRKFSKFMLAVIERGLRVAE